MSAFQHADADFMEPDGSAVGDAVGEIVLVVEAVNKALGGGSHFAEPDVENVPAGQGTQEILPSWLYVLTSHNKQLLTDTAP